MAQNRSTAVMQRRHEAPDSLDYFPTPPWATRALCEWLSIEVGSLNPLKVWEPACGEGYMARPLAEYFQYVYATDVHDYSDSFSDQAAVKDFLLKWDHSPKIQKLGMDWVITNPPFRLALEFISMGLEVCHSGVAVLVRTAFLELQDRYNNLYSKTPPSDILQFVERVAMVRGRVDEDASSATAYCWIIFRKGHSGPTRFHWIVPARAKLERSADYPKVEKEIASAPLFDGAAE